MSSSSLESSTSPSGSGTPPQRLRSPCGTRIQRMRTRRTDHNMPRSWRAQVKLCSVLRSARGSCETSSRPPQVISLLSSKDVWMSWQRISHHSYNRNLFDYSYLLWWQCPVSFSVSILVSKLPVSYSLTASCMTVSFYNILPLYPSLRMNSDTVDYDDSCLIVRYLASMRPFAQSFDIYLTQVIFGYSYHNYLYLFNKAQQLHKIMCKSFRQYNKGDIKSHWFVFVL